MPALRRIVLAAAIELRTAGVAEDQMRELFATLIEDIARERGIDAPSVPSGAPRSVELVARVNEWVRIAH